MIVNHNISSINAWRNVQKTDEGMSRSLEKLSSGLRINRAADDAAGLAISEKMRAQITALDVATRNASDGISMIQTAEGGMAQVASIVQRMRELAIQAANGTYSDTDKANLQTEVSQLVSEINNISSNIKFNGLTILDGSYSATGVKFQIGVNAGDLLEVNIDNISGSALGTGVAGNVSVLSLNDIDLVGHAEESIKAIDKTIDEVTNRRAKLGAYQNRLEHTIDNLSTTSENLTAAESRIRDTDMAKEMAEFTKFQVLLQSGVAMMAQSNQKTQAVMKLLG